VGESTVEVQDKPPVTRHTDITWPPASVGNKYNVYEKTTFSL